MIINNFRRFRSRTLDGGVAIATRTCQDKKTHRRRTDAVLKETLPGVSEIFSGTTAGFNDHCCDLTPWRFKESRLAFVCGFYLKCRDCFGCCNANRQELGLNPKRRFIRGAVHYVGLRELYIERHAVHLGRQHGGDWDSASLTSGYLWLSPLLAFSWF